MALYNKDRIVTADKVEIKDIFKERYRRLLGDKYDDFMRYSFTYLRKCIRVNTLKATPETIRKRIEDQGWVLTPVPWCAEGFFVEGHKEQDRFDIGNMIEHTLGYFYVQEAASMIPPVVLLSDKDEMSGEEKDHLKVLDLCAAPGSKSSQLAQYMDNRGVLIANDVDVTRLKPLTMNLQRMGVTNMLVTLNPFQRSKRNTRLRNPFGNEDGRGEFFDRILVDAPCSGTGTIRRSFKMLAMYSEGLVKRLASTQKALIQNAFEMLKPGGEMVYSTCTHEPLENEGIVSFLLDKYKTAEIIPIDLNIKRSEPVIEFDGLQFRDEVKHCIRIYPQDNDSEGFFVCKIRKKEAPAQSN
ncbi:MAG: NOL1/NOP2/sun family putative RNA methylase [Candidatus Woesearchaeota archaeon]